MIQTAIGSTQGLADTEKTEMENMLEGAPELALILLATGTVMGNVGAGFKHLDHNIIKLKFQSIYLFCAIQLQTDELKSCFPPLGTV